jgi:hypothetical protein
VGNDSVNRGSVLYNVGDSDPVLTNCIAFSNPDETIGNLDSSSASISYSAFEGLSGGPGNIDVDDPLFVDEGAENYALMTGSPCIDTGQNTNTMAFGFVAVDIEDDARGFDGDGFGAISGDGSEFDMGAYEAPSTGGNDDPREIPSLTHVADTDGDQRIGFNELLRIVQFYNANGLSCAMGTEDGFAPGGGAENCTPHVSDYAPQDWEINLTEILRAVQLYNAGGYVPCMTSEDGYCPVTQ